MSNEEPNGERENIGFDDYGAPTEVQAVEEAPPEENVAVEAVSQVVKCNVSAWQSLLDYLASDFDDDDY